MTSRQHTVIAIALVLTGVYLMHLTSLEVQPWDEGLYAVRALGIVEFDNWADQTPHSIGGLYSSTAPPFVPWMLAASIAALGPSAMALRLPIVLCSCIALFMVYLIARRLVTHEHAIVAMCMLSGALHWSVFARQAMTEVPLMMWCLIALWSAIVWNETMLSARGSAARRGFAATWWPAVVFGAALGMALMTKMVVSFLPLAFLVPLTLAHRKERQFVMHIALALTIAAAIAVPWHAMMISKHGVEFLAGVPFAHLFSTVEGNSHALGPLFYLNQLVIAHAFIVVAFLYVIMAMVKRELLPSRSQYAAVATLTWFVAAFLVFSVASTKHLHYTVMILPAAVLTAVFAAERFMLLANRRFLVVTYGVVTALTIWAFLPAAHRQAFRTSPFDTTVLVEGLILVGVIFAGFLLPAKRLPALSLQLFKPIVYGITALFLVKTVVKIIDTDVDGVRGGRAVAVQLLEKTTPTFTYLYHKRNDGDQYNPQLDWYLSGWMTNWTRARSYKPVAMPEDGVSDSSSVLGIEGHAVHVVYMHAVQPHTNRLLDRVREDLLPSYESKDYDDYTLFTRRR